MALIPRERPDWRQLRGWPEKPDSEAMVRLQLRPDIVTKQRKYEAQLREQEAWKSAVEARK